MNDLSGDSRIRVHYSEILWVITKIPPSGIDVFGIQESIERVVCTIEGYQGYYVRYHSHFYPLHPKEEFEELRQKALNSELYFYSNHHGL